MQIMFKVQRNKDQQGLQNQQMQAFISYSLIS